MFHWWEVLFSLLTLYLTFSRRYGSSLSVFITLVIVFWKAVVWSCCAWWLQLSRCCSSSIFWHHDGHNGVGNKFHLCILWFRGSNLLTHFVTKSFLWKGIFLYVACAVSQSTVSNSLSHLWWYVEYSRLIGLLYDLCICDAWWCVIDISLISSMILLAGSIVTIGFTIIFFILMLAISSHLTLSCEFLGVVLPELTHQGGFWRVWTLGLPAIVSKYLLFGFLRLL